MKSYPIYGTCREYRSLGERSTKQILTNCIACQTVHNNCIDILAPQVCNINETNDSVSRHFIGKKSAGNLSTYRNGQEICRSRVNGLTECVRSIELIQRCYSSEFVALVLLLLEDSPKHAMPLLILKFHERLPALTSIQTRRPRQTRLIW